MHFAIALLAALTFALPCAQAGAGNQTRCEPSGIAVSGASAEERANACTAVGDALRVLSTMDIPSAGGVRIELVHLIPPNGTQHTLGYFDGEQNVVFLLDYEASIAGAKAHHTWMSESLWRSYLAHEVTHAAALSKDVAGRLTFPEHEYLAAVVQLSTLPEADRKEILEKFPDARPFEHRSEMTEVLYMTNPGLFAVKAYLHYMAPGNGPGFVALLFSDKR
jgi:hypothetical protein